MNYSPMNFVLIGLMLALITACSGGSGTAVEANPDLSTQVVNARALVLSGPTPRTTDVQSFRIELWENIAVESRCGGCHVAGGQSPFFARNDDINLAYDAASSLVDLNSPVQSRLAVKVGGGHNCWLESDQACADILTTWITNWSGDQAGSNTTIVLSPPEARDPGASRSFPDGEGEFASTVHPLLTTYCSDCHTDTGAVAQSPFFAVADASAAYESAKSKIELDDTAASRFVVRLGSEFHNCWDNCVANAAEMQAAIDAFVALVPETEVDPSLVVSRALRLADGTVASGGGRVDTHAIALYQFKQMPGNTAFDTSGVDPALNLTFSGDVTWVGGWGIQFGDAGKAQGSTSSSAKLHELITATGEYSVEAWVVPGNVTQEEASIIGYSGGTAARNFTLAQTLYNYDFLARFEGTDGNGLPALSTPDADEVLQASLQHVVATFSPTDGRRLYVNGALIEVMDDGGGSISDWDDTFALVMGNEVSSNRLFRGVLRLAAIHNRVLSDEQILANFDAGVGQQFFLLFGVSHLIGVPEAYIVFSVSQFDSYSWLFSSPYFLSLDDTVEPDNIPIAGMRIGINGREPIVGQAYSTLNTSLTNADYESGTGQVLSDVGTIVGIEKGPDSDEFFLTFEQLGEFTNVVVVANPDPVLQTDLAPASDLGIKTFDEIHASFAAATGVAMTHPDVRATYLAVRQALPASANIEGFLSSQQMAITQLAIEYCNALVDDTTLRAARFPAFDFGVAPASAFDAAGKEALLTPLLNGAMGDNVASQPDRTAARAELESLVDRLAVAGGDAGRTQTIVKATCAAAIGNAALLLQ